MPNFAVISSEYSADTGETRRMNLSDRDRARLEDPLRHHASMCACGHTVADGFEFTPVAGMIDGAVERASFA